MNILERNIETLLPSKKDFENALGGKKKIRVKLGIDPTGPNIHMGNAVVLWKLREFQDAGHAVVLIFGDFTARIGDPGDKEKRRPVLAKEQIDENVSNYVGQIERILDTKKIELHYNSEWHEKMTEVDLIKLSRLLTVNQMLMRRNFSERFKEKKEIGIDEFLYPLLQGYDSVAIQADVELGGSDQLFNLEAGRIIQEAYGQKPQLVMTMKMLWGLDGRKMSKSWGNVVNIIDEPNDMFGKLMALDDRLMPEYFELATPLSLAQIKNIEAQKDTKAQKERLAFEIVKRYHGEREARKAQKEFNHVFSKRKLPHHIPEFIVTGAHSTIEVLVNAGLATSKSEARRLIAQGGILVDGKPPSDTIEVTKEVVVSRGRRKFVKLLPPKM